MDVVEVEKRRVSKGKEMRRVIGKDDTLIASGFVSGGGDYEGEEREREEKRRESEMRGDRENK